jgi:hypothetical protein
LNNVLEAAIEYQKAEEALTLAHQAGKWDGEAKTAKRKAGELAVAIDGLTDRAHLEFKATKGNIRADVSLLCFWPGSTTSRHEAFERVHAVADA